MALWTCPYCKKQVPDKYAVCPFCRKPRPGRGAPRAATPGTVAAKTAVPKKKGTNMTIWKLVSGILSILFSGFIVFQSFFAGLFNIFSNNGESSGTAGVIVAALLLAGGIVSIVVRKSGRAGNIAIMVIDLLAAAVGFLMAGSYKDLLVWSGWCVLCAILALVCLITGAGVGGKETTGATKEKSHVSGKWWVVTALLCIVCLAVGFGIGSMADIQVAEKDVKPDKAVESKESGDTAHPNEPSSEPSKDINDQTGQPSSSGDLGKYHVEIKEASLTTDTDDAPVIIVTYSWTNNSEETTSAMMSIVNKAFQDGIELDTAYIPDSEIYNSENNMKDVRPGASLDIQRAFMLRNTTSVVELELSEAFSFSDDTVLKTFDLSTL